MLVVTAVAVSVLVAKTVVKVVTLDVEKSVLVVLTRAGTTVEVVMMVRSSVILFDQYGMVCVARGKVV
jgi:hypothetical protein